MLTARKTGAPRVIVRSLVALTEVVVAPGALAIVGTVLRTSSKELVTTLSFAVTPVSLTVMAAMKVATASDDLASQEDIAVSQIGFVVVCEPGMSRLMKFHAAATEYSAPSRLK